MLSVPLAVCVNGPFTTRKMPVPPLPGDSDPLLVNAPVTVPVPEAAPALVTAPTSDPLMMSVEPLAGGQLQGCAGSDGGRRRVSNPGRAHHQGTGIDVRRAAVGIGTGKRRGSGIDRRERPSPRNVACERAVGRIVDHQRRIVED